MKILVIDDLDPIFEELLLSSKIEVVYELNIQSKAELMALLPSYDGVVVRSKFYFDKELISAMHEGQFIARAGAGMDNIDVDEAAKRKIYLINAPEGNRDAVAEHVIGMVLSYYRNILISDAQIREGKWLREDNRGFELKGKTFGIIGYGNTGKALAKKLSGFEMNVIAYDKYLTNFSDDYVHETSLNEVISSSDILSLHIPLTSETSHFLNHEILGLARKTPLIVNTSRGKVINTSDLIQSIKSGKVFGACLDVLENEHIESYNAFDYQWYNELIDSSRVVLTSHIAGWTFESYRRISEVLAAKIRSYMYNR